jgi:hypothetical protein
MDVMIFMGAATVGFALGLTCRRNNIHLLPNYEKLDMGVLGKKHYNEGIKRA